ncbi:hypothetical protein GCM10010416_19580 [Streptomyces caniferus]
MTPLSPPEGIPESVKLHLVGDLLTAAVAVRVFGRDALAVLRRAAAVGVLMGLSELRIRRPGPGGER